MGFNGIDSDWARNLTTNGISREDKWIYPALWLRKMAHIDGVATKKSVVLVSMAMSPEQTSQYQQIQCWELLMCFYGISLVPSSKLT